MVNALSYSLSMDGLKNLIKRLLEEAKTKFDMTESITEHEEYEIWDYGLGDLKISAWGHTLTDGKSFAVEITSKENKTDAPALFVANRVSQFPTVRLILRLYNPERATDEDSLKPEPQRSRGNEAFSEKTVSESNIDSEILNALKEIKDKIADISEIKDAIRKLERKLKDIEDEVRSIRITVSAIQEHED